MHSYLHPFGIALCFLFGAGAAVLAWQAFRRPRSVPKVIESVFAELILLFLAAMILPNFEGIRIRRGCSSCVANMKQMQGAKETWALEFKKARTDIPQVSDLTGETNYIRVEPECPAGGVYTWGRVQDYVTCSIGGEGHRWPEPPVELDDNGSRKAKGLYVGGGVGLGLIAVMVWPAARRRGRGTSCQPSQGSVGPSP